MKHVRDQIAAAFGVDDRDERYDWRVEQEKGKEQAVRIDIGGGTIRGFTLVELLVILAILAVLAAILFPAIGRATDNARAVVCKSNLRQLTFATLLYVQNNQDHPPGVAVLDPVGLPHDWVHWQKTRNISNSALLKYLGSTAILNCPSDRPESHWHSWTNTVTGAYPFSYTLNRYLGYGGYYIPPKYSKIRSPSRLILFIEEDPSGLDDGAAFLNYGQTDHVGTMHDRTARRKIQALSATLANPKSFGIVSFVDGHVGTLSAEEAKLDRHFRP